MAIVSADFPGTIGLFHTRDGGEADWNVLVREFNAPIVVDSDEPINYADDINVELEVGGESAVVGAVYTDSDYFFDWQTDDDEAGTYELVAMRDGDSSRIVAQHDAEEYDGLPPGEGDWVVYKSTFSDYIEIHREPVTVVPEWVSPNVLSLQNCSASGRDLRPGDQTTLSATIDNPSFDPLAGEAVAFVGSTEASIPFEVPARGETAVEATFEVTGSGRMEYGFDFRGVGHNY